MTQTATKSKQGNRPPYIPWKTLVNFVGRWKKDTVPHTINTTVMTTMSGGLASQLISSLRFLQLIDSTGVVQPSFEALVEAHGTDQWAGAVKEHIVDAYAGIVGDLPLENAIASQLDDCFRTKVGADGQVLGKCVRFYLHALRDSGVKYSPHFTMRRESKSNGRARKKATVSKDPPKTVKPKEAAAQKPSSDDLPGGLIEIPLTIPGKTPGQKLIVSTDLDEADCEYIDAMLRAQAKRIALAKEQ